jgi:Ca2+/Na+ antiporter
MQAPNAVTNNPNASVTAVAGAVTVLLVWIIGVAGLSMPAEVGSALTTVVAGVILWVGPRQTKNQMDPTTTATTAALVEIQ